MKENYITTKQAATLTGYTTDYVGQLARQGHIDSHKEGRKRLVSINDLFTYIQEKEHGSSDTRSEDKKIITSSKLVTINDNDDTDNKYNPAEPSPYRDTVSPVVSKTVISPWANLDEEKIKSDVESVRQKIELDPVSTAHYSNFIPATPKSLTNLPANGPNFQLLPVMSMTASVMAVLVFMMTIGIFVNGEAKKVSTSLTIDNQIAAINSLDMPDKVAYKWYEAVNSIVK